MGADFLMAWCLEPTESEIAAMKREIATMDEEDMEDLDIYEDADGWRDRMNRCVDHLVDNSDDRDCLMLQLGNCVLLMSGGMSGGDSPTEMCDAIWDLQRSELLPYPGDQIMAWRKSEMPPKEIIEEALAGLDSILRKEQV